MIQIERTYTITLLDSNVINYTITSNKPSCITIDNASGSFNGTTIKIYVTYHVANLDCFKDNTITIIVTNDKGCSNTFTDTLINECNSLDVSLTQPDVNDLIFKATVTGGKEPYYYNWIYGSTNSFDSDEPESVDGYHTQDYVSLRWINTTLQEGTLAPQAIRVKVKDANGCISEGVTYYTISCKPIIASQTVAAKCSILTTATGVVENRKFEITLTNLGCGNLNNNPLIITGATQRSLTNNRYEITVPEFSTESLVLPVKIANDKNIISDTFNITIIKSGDCKIKPDCAAGFDLSTYKNYNRILTFDNSLPNISEVINFSTLYVDYTTFTFVASTGQTLANNILTITGKGTATFNTTTRTITYTKITATEENIPIKWKVKNECGIYSDEYTLTINSVLSTAPAVNNITANVVLGTTLITTVGSTNSTTISSLKTLSSPTVGTISVNGNVVTYTPINYSATTQTVTLQPVNQYGKVGNSFTVTHTILSSGIARPLTTCSALTSYNLFNLLVAGSYTTGGTWTSSPSVNTGNLATITTAGIYNFTYTVTSGGLTKSTTVTINYSSASITSVGVTNLEFNTRTVKITTSGFTQSELDLISYVTVNVITPTKQLSLTTNLITDRNGDILFTEIDITDEDGIILSDYTRIEVVIPEEKSPCATIITASYVKPAVGLVSTLTASVIVNDSTIFNCEGGYTYTYNSATEIYTGYKSVAAIAPASPYGVEIGDSNVFGIYGTRIYPVNGWNDKGDLKSGYTYQNLMTTSYWQNTAVADFEKGPCNRYGIWANDGEASTDLPFGKWIGFSKCITIAESKTYYVGLFADNNFKLRLNGQTILNTYQTGGSLNSTQATFFYWHIYPIDIPAGNNTLELTGLNIQQTGAFGCVIYDNTPTQLVAATSDGNLNIIFNSRTITNIDIVESTLGVYEDKGYTCPPGYTVYSPCGGNNCYQYIVCGTPNSN
jgi:hypothetical protein